MAKHLIIFNNGGVVSATTPKDWARAHQDNFPNHAFDNAATTPTTNAIEAHMTNNLGYEEIGNDDIVILYRLRDL